VPDIGVDTATTQFPLPSYYGTTPILTTPVSELNDGKFNECSPGAQLTFNVTFKMPFQRSSLAQSYQFDLGIYAGSGLVARKRVILENPALQVASYYRYYDSTKVCPAGTHVVWGDLSYTAICPQDGANDFSQIRFCATAGTTAASTFTPVASGLSDTNFASEGGIAGGGCDPGEVLVGVATANTNPSVSSGSPGIPSGGQINTCPATGSAGMGYSCAPANPTSATPASAWTTCTAQTAKAGCTSATTTGWAGNCAWLVPLGFNVGTVLQASGPANNAGLATDTYLRLRMELDPSIPGDVVPPLLTGWNLDIDCSPSE